MPGPRGIMPAGPPAVMPGPPAIMPPGPPGICRPGPVGWESAGSSASVSPVGGAVAIASISEVAVADPGSAFVVGSATVV